MDAAYVRRHFDSKVPVETEVTILEEDDTKLEEDEVFEQDSDVT